MKEIAPVASELLPAANDSFPEAFKQQVLFILVTITCCTKLIAFTYLFYYAKIPKNN